MEKLLNVRTGGLAAALLGLAAGTASAQMSVPYGYAPASSTTRAAAPQVRSAPVQTQANMPYAGYRTPPPQAAAPSPAQAYYPSAPVRVYQTAPSHIYRNALPPAYPYSLPPTRASGDGEVRSGIVYPTAPRTEPRSVVTPIQRSPQRSDNAPVARVWTNVGGTDRALRVTTPVGPRYVTSHEYYNTIYGGGGTPPPTYNYAPPLLGGYYYGNYCDNSYGAYSYPSVFSYYSGFPAYIYTPGVIILAQPYFPVYYTGYLPFYTPTYQVTYNENTYYVGSEERATQLQQGGAPAQEALRHAYAAGSFQAAFADIENAWRDGSMAPLRKHLPDDDTKISVFLQRKYRYSIAASDFAQITRDALTRLDTVSFDFTRVRKAKNGDVTAYGTHVYKAGEGVGKTEDMTSANDTVPFDQSEPYDKSSDPATGEEKTVYVSYTLHHRDDQWYIIGIDSSSEPLVK